MRCSISTRCCARGSSRRRRTPSGIPTAVSSLDSALAYYVFSLRNLATYPHPIRIAALNLGPKILELAWMEGLAEAIADPELKGVFESQLVENRSHINMGRRIVEEFVDEAGRGRAVPLGLRRRAARLRPLPGRAQRLRARARGAGAAGAARGK